MQIVKLEEENDAQKAKTGSCSSNIELKVLLENLLPIIGKPSTLGSGDNKVQLDWVFLVGEDKCITIYDWKEYDKSINFIDEWHVGSKNLTKDEVKEVLSELYLAKYISSE